MKIGFAKDAEKQFKKLPKVAQVIVTKRIRQLHADQYIQTEKLTSYKGLYRTRVGQYRIVYRKLTNRLVVVLTGHRKEVYKILKSILR